MTLRRGQPARFGRSQHRSNQLHFRHMRKFVKTPVARQLKKHTPSSCAIACEVGRKHRFPARLGRRAPYEQRGGKRLPSRTGMARRRDRFDTFLRHSQNSLLLRSALGRPTRGEVRRGGVSRDVGLLTGGQLHRGQRRRGRGRVGLLEACGCAHSLLQRRRRCIHADHGGGSEQRSLRSRHCRSDPVLRGTRPFAIRGPGALGLQTGVGVLLHLWKTTGGSWIHLPLHMRS